MLIAVIIISAVIILALAGLFASYYKTFYSPHKDMSETEVPGIISKHPYGDKSRKLIEEIREKPCEFIEARSYDGLKLSARYYKGRDDMPLCICFHGYRGSAVRDFSGGGLFLMKEGYNVILPDHRAHWRSQGHTITYGLRERYDVLTWINYANERFGKDIPIYIFGISMGGGTVLMASGLELPENVRAISADCPYNSPKDIIKHVCKRIKLNPTLCWPIVWISGLIYGRFNCNKTTAADEVKKSKTPILIIHGEGDDFVPPYMSEEVRQANPDMVERHTFPNAGHGLSYLYDSERYQSIIREFIAKNP